MDCNESRELLPLSIDRELDARTEGVLAAHLATCAACEDERTRLTGLVADIRRSASYHRAPDPLRERIQGVLPAADGAGARPPRRDKGWRGRLVWQLLNGGGLVAAACAAIVLVFAWPQSPSSDQAVAEALMTSHTRALLTNHVIDVASSDQHTVKPWFSARLDFSPPVRDLADHGFPLAGGRLDYLDGRTVAVLVYHFRQHVIEVFVWPRVAAESAMSPQTLEGYHIVGWTSGGLTLRAVSDADPAELMRLAALLRQ